MQADDIDLKGRPSPIPVESLVGFVGLAAHGAYGLQALFVPVQS